MDHEFPDPDLPLAPEWWAPLAGVVESVAGVDRHRFLDIDDFMLMARIRRSPRPSITLYKHVYTRRYVNLDASGQAYRYIAPRELTSSNHGRYVRCRSLDDALDSLRLWELPWMKEGLEHERCGLAWEERFTLLEALEAGVPLSEVRSPTRPWTPVDAWADPTPSPAARGDHLRLVRGTDNS